jgi:DNA invertase Pin-like site-specific DNA recombinase
LIYGYARVSTSEQETTMQIDALNRAGVQEIYQEKTSSIGARIQLRVLMTVLKKDDLLIVYKLDRLARSLKDLLSILEQIEHTGCGFRSLTEPIDTVSPAGRLMLNILGSVAEFERSLIRERSIAGQLAAIKNGRWPGRPKVLLLRPCEVLSRIANPAILEVAHNAFRVLLQHRHVIVGSLA